MKNLLLLSIALIFYDAMLAKVSPPRAVVSSIGKDAVVCNIKWTYTVGEAVIYSYSNCNLKLTQSFQQPEIADCSGRQNKPVKAISIYPNLNRLSSHHTFVLPNEESGAIANSIYDAAGKLAKSMELKL